MHVSGTTTMRHSITSVPSWVSRASSANRNPPQSANRIPLSSPAAIAREAQEKQQAAGGEDSHPRTEFFHDPFKGPWQDLYEGEVIELFVPGRPGEGGKLRSGQIGRWQAGVVKR